MSLRARLLAHLGAKLGLTLALNAFFWPAYLWLSRHAVFPVRPPPRTWLDDAVPFQPEPWGWVYLSQFLFTGTLPWLIATADGLRRFVASFAIMGGGAFAVFLFSPTMSPRPADLAASGAMAIIAGYDGPLNALPSLHAAFLACYARLAWRLFGPALPLAAKLIAAAWGAAILYATLATRQHYAVDLLAGGALGLAADALAWRGAGAAAAMTIERSAGARSHAG